MPFELNHELKVDIDRDSAARQSFVSDLRAYLLNDMAAAMREAYESRVLPEFERRHGRLPATQDEVHDAMRTDPSFKFYSSVRYNAQEMVWRCVTPCVERELGQIEARIRELSGSAGGSLTLDPELPIPENPAG